MDYLESKKIRQEQSADRFFRAGGNGMLIAPTGFGKTYQGLIVIKKYLEFNKSNPDISIVIVTPNVPIRDQWFALVEDQYKDRVKFYTADEILNLEYILSCSLLLVDEIHLFYSSERIKIIENILIKRKRICGLTATPYDKQKRHEEVFRYCPIIDEVTEEEALQNNWISDYIEYNYGIELEEEEQQKYEEISERISYFMNKFGKHGFTLATNILSGGLHNGVFYPGHKWAIMWATKNGWSKSLNLAVKEDLEINRQWNPNIVIGYAKNLMAYVRERKDFLYSHPTKITAAVQIYRKFKLKTIFFSQSTFFADTLYERINAIDDLPKVTIYHSKLESRPLINPDTGEYDTYKTGKKAGQPILYGTTVLKKLAISNLKDNIVNGIVTVSSLDAGLSINDLECAIICSGTTSATQKKQRDGRIKRIDDNKIFTDNPALIVNIFITNTKDYSWLRERQMKSTNPIYWVYDIDEINFQPINLKDKKLFN